MAEIKFCPHCMAAAESAVCPVCHKSTSYIASPWALPAGASPDGNGHYCLGAVLGQGGFGITYIGLDTVARQQVAIKELFPVKCVRREKNIVAAFPGWEKVYMNARKSFLDEARMLYDVQGLSAVVRVNNYFEANGTAYIVMEYLDGITLESKLKQGGAIPAEELIPKLKPLIADLTVLHAKGIVHRDIAPDNIMWMPDGTLKLLDFGAARSIEDGKSATINLKQGFSPVEQYTRHGQGAWTDVYALCTTVYYCLTGKVPPNAPDRLETDTLISPSDLGVKLTETQEQALLWGLTVQPQKRPQNMREFANKFLSLQKQSFWQRVQEWCAKRLQSLRRSYTHKNNNL